MQAQGAGNWPYGGPFTYIEDVFSTWLYSGTGAAQTITNNVNLATNGGLVWIKDRSAGNSHRLADTTRGNTNYISSNNTTAQVTSSTDITAFNATGFSLGTGATLATNDIGTTYASWTFREQQKFFDIVTYTGNGTNNRAIAHALGSAPGCVIVKSTSNAQNWPVFHRSTGANTIFWLNATNANTANSGYFPTAPDATSFYVGTDTDVNQNGYTYVAYLFAHNAGGFGTSGNDNVITCGSFTTDGSGNIPAVTLGYEPQWILFKNASSSQGWWLFDTMRGLSLTAQAGIQPNTSGVEQLYSSSSYVYPTATGFAGSGSFFGNSVSVIYIAIRRGPMKVPTVGTSVYNAIARTGTGAVAQVTGVGFPPDLVATGVRSSGGSVFNDRLRGAGYVVYPFSTSAENYQSTGVTAIGQNGISLGNDVNGYVNYSGSTYINWFFQRAPGFFDEVCYTGDGNLNISGTVYNVTHNLTVFPELVIIKRRNTADENWLVACALNSTQWVNGPTTGFALNRSDTASTPINFSSSSYATTTTFRPAVIGGGYLYSGNDSGGTYVAYLFATCPGVSKVGSYSGTGATQTINCGFTGGARFVLIKRTDTTGDWYVWDTARGMVSGTDPSLLLNTTAAEVNANSVYTTGVGFQIVSTAAGINASGGTYIFLAVA
jgi:hypothetical protein